jgi:hypothetical protein
MSALPAATHTHIRNARLGAQEAAAFDAKPSVIAKTRPRRDAVVASSAEAAPAP